MILKILLSALLAPFILLAQETTAHKRNAPDSTPASLENKKKKTAAATVSTAATAALPTTASAASASSTPATAAAASAPVAQVDVKPDEENLLDIIGQPKEIQRIVDKYLAGDFAGDGDYQLAQKFHAGHPLKNTYSHYKLVYSPNGAYLVSALEKEIKIWDAATLRLIKTLEAGSDIFAFAPDSSYLISIKYGNFREPTVIDFWDPKTGNLLAQHKRFEPQIPAHDFAISASMFSFGGFQYLILTTYNGNLMLYAIANQTLFKIASQSLIDTTLTNALISYDGTNIATLESQGEITIRNIQSLKETICNLEYRHVPAGGSRKLPVAFSPDNKYLVLGGSVFTIIKIDTCSEIYSNNVASIINHIAFLPNGKIVYSNQNEELKIANFGSLISKDISPEAPQIIANNGEIGALAIAPNSNIAIITKDGNISIFRKSLMRRSKYKWPETGNAEYERIYKFRPAPKQDSRALFYAPRGNILGYLFNDGFHWLNLLTESETGFSLDNRNPNYRLIEKAVLSSDGTYLIMIIDGLLAYYNLEAKQFNPIKIENQISAISALLFSPDNQLLTIGTNRGDIRILKTETLLKIAGGKKSGILTLKEEDFQKIQNTQDKRIERLVFSPDGNQLAAISDSKIHFFKMADLIPVKTVQLNDFSPEEAMYSPDGQYFLMHSSDRGNVHSKGIIHVMSLHTYSEVYALKTPRAITQYGFSPDGKTLWYTMKENSNIMFLPVTVFTDRKDAQQKLEQNEQEAPITKLPVGGIIISVVMLPDGTIFIATANGEIYGFKKVARETGYAIGKQE